MTKCDFVSEVRCESVSALDEAIQRMCTPFQSTGSHCLPCWLFRGHADETWPLLASLHRKLRMPTESDRRLIQMIVNQDVSFGNVDAKIEDLVTAQQRSNYIYNILTDASRRLCTFCAIAADVGLLDGAASVNAHQVLNRDSAHIMQHFGAEDNVAIWGLAQHHGMGTELLDWTRSPLIAIWFALDGIARLPKTNSGTACIWAVSLLSVQQSFPRLKVYRLVDQNFARAQGGLFTYDTTIIRRFIDDGSVLDQADLVRECSRSNHSPSIVELCSALGLVKITFPHALASEVYSLLRVHNVTKAHLKPTLENVVALADGPIIR